jgi:hypothetical protein
MYQFLRALLGTMLLFFAFKGVAQSEQAVTFRFAKERINAKELVVEIHATVQPGVKLYALQQSSTDPLYSTPYYFFLEQKKTSLLQKASVMTLIQISLSNFSMQLLLAIKNLNNGTGLRLL